MTATLAAAMTLFGIALLFALVVIPTALASLIGAQWICAGVALAFLAAAFVLMMVETWLYSQRKG